MEFLAIGDMVVDTFIRLKEAEVHCDINNEHCTISMRFGDKIPFELAKAIPAVGNSANAAVAAARLGLASAFVSGVGKDRDGGDCLARLTQENVATDLITVKDGGETSNNFVLWYGPERTILVKYASFEYDLPQQLPAPKVVYLSGIGEANAALYDHVADWLEKSPDIIFALQPGTFEMKAGLARLTRLYARANILISNKEEYQRVLGSAEEDVKKLMETMRTHGPKICFLTDGPEGAYAQSDDGSWKIGLYPDGKNAYERTGAGDAFSSSVAVALSLGKSVPEALTWGPINSAFVVQKIGAQEGLLTRAELEEKLKAAPADYKAVPF
jgi:sugar/nucleoside kinase (ribokinase family)